MLLLKLPLPSVFICPATLHFQTYSNRQVDPGPDRVSDVNEAMDVPSKNELAWHGVGASIKIIIIQSQYELDQLFRFKNTPSIL